MYAILHVLFNSLILSSYSMHHVMVEQRLSTFTSFSPPTLTANNCELVLWFVLKSKPQSQIVSLNISALQCQTLYMPSLNAVDCFTLFEFDPFKF